VAGAIVAAPLPQAQSNTPTGVVSGSGTAVNPNSPAAIDSIDRLPCARQILSVQDTAPQDQDRIRRLALQVRL